MAKTILHPTELVDERATSRAADAMDHHVGKRMKKRRSALGISRATLGDTLGISQQQVGKYESADTRISAGRLHQIAQELKVSVDYFFQTDDAAPPAEPDPILCAIATTPDGQTLLSALGVLTGDQRRILVSLAEMLTQPPPPSLL